MASHKYDFDLTHDTNNIIHNQLWSLVQAGDRSYDISRFFKGSWPGVWSLCVQTDTRYVRRGREYTEQEWLDQKHDAFKPGRFSFKRRVYLTARILTTNPFRDDGSEMITDTVMTTRFDVDHTSKMDACLGLMLFSWSEADPVIHAEGFGPRDEERTRLKVALISQVGKEAGQTVKAKTDELTKMLSKVKI